MDHDAGFDYTLKPVEDGATAQSQLKACRCLVSTLWPLQIQLKACRGSAKLVEGLQKLGKIFLIAKKPTEIVYMFAKPVLTTSKVVEAL